MKEFYKRGRRLFAAFLGALVMMNQLGILTPAVVHGQEVGSVTYEAVDEGSENLAVESNTAKAVKNQTVLTFTSDIHNASNNEAADRLDKWLDVIIDTYGGIDAQSFCGDMGEAGDTTDKWWTYVQTVMDVVDQKNLPGVYTTGNHEFYNGKFATTSNSLKNKYIVDNKGLEGSNYIIYCLGTDNWDNYSDNYTTDQIAKLQSFLNTAGKAKPIIILTHYPLHRYGSSRETKNADKVIEALNNGAASGQKIVLLWGHNHTLSDTNYDEIFEPGRTIEYASGKSETIQFYYAAAGCMSDSEYGTGSAFVKGKGLVIRINDEDKLTFTYYDASGKNDVTEGGTYTEADPVDATAIAVSPKTLTVQTGESANLSITYTPSDTTNKKITWTSSDPSVATVSGGKVTGVSKGTATITATYTDNPDLTDSATVTVTKAAGSGVTPEDGKKYVILAGDGYALTSEGDTVGYTNGDSSQEFNYIGLSGEEYTVGEDVIPDRFLWTFISTGTKSGESYYIQSNDGRYLNGIYKKNDTGGYDGTLKLDDTKDIWVITAPTSGSTVSGSILKSTNASNSDSGEKFLTHGNSGSNSGSGNTNIFTLRSADNATTSLFYEYDDEGTYVPDPDEPDDPPTPPTPTDGAIYKLTDNFTSGKDYLIVSANTAGSGYALTNPGGTSGGADMGSTGVTIKSGDVDEDGTNDTYISTDKTDVVWTATANGSGFDITNSTDYLEGKSGNVKIFSSQQYADRIWTYTDSQLKHSGGTNTYVVYYSNGFTSTYNSTSEKIYLYEKVDGGTEPENPDDPDDPPTPPTPTDGAIYKLADNFTSGKDYLIVNANAAGSGYALTNPGGTSGGADMGSTGVTIKSGDVDEDGTNDTYISTDKTDVVWTATANGSGFDITNSTDYLEGKSGNVKIFSSQQYADRIWSYTDSQLKHSGGTNTYVVYYSNGFTSTYDSTSEKIYLYEKVDGGTEPENPENPDDPPTPPTPGGDQYEETTTLNSGEEYIIAVTKDDGSVYAMDNSGSTVSATELTLTAAADDNPAYVTTDKTSVLWKYTSEDKYFTNSGDYLYPSSSNGIMTYSSGRAIDYADGKMSFSTSSSGTYYITFNSGEFSTSKTESDAVAIRLFTKASGDTPDDPPTPVDKSKYVLTAVLKDGGKYLITNNADVDATTTRALKNPGGNENISSSNGKSSVTIQEGDYILTADTDIVWTATAHGDGFYLSNNEDYLEVYQTKLRSSNPVKQEDRYWTYQDGVLEHVGSTSSHYYLTYESGSFSSVTESAKVYLFELENEQPQHTHIWDEGTVTKEATCKEEGEMSYTCTVCGEIKTEPIDKKPHTVEVIAGKDATCTETGLTEGKKCSVCGEIIEAQTVIPATGHTVEVIKGKDATCTESGLTEGKKCSVCGEIIEAQTVIPATGHTVEVIKGKDATCTESGLTDGKKCSVCGEIIEAQTVIPATGHTVEVVKGKDATCTEPGLTEGKKCSVCGEIIEAQKDIPATGHTVEVVKGKDATCTEPGLTDGKKCSVCGEILEAQTDISATGHTVEVVKGKDATCTEPGLTDGKKCSVCGAILEAQTEIPAKDHTWDEGKVTKKATCTEPGKEIFTCTVCGATREVEISASGHKWSFKGFTWVKDGEDYTATAEYVCDNDDAHVEAVTSEISKNAIDPTCTESGSITYTATISAEAAPDHKDREYVKEIDKPALGHTIIIHEAKAATCEEDGVTEGQECSVCKEILKKQLIIPKLGHQEEILEASVPTCTESGLTEGKKCSRCNKTLVAQEVLPAIGHDWDDGKIIKDATCTKDGEMLFTCKNDAGHTKTEAIQAKGHEWSFKKFTWIDSGEDVTATFDYVCKNDETHTQTVIPEITKESVDATCTVPGKVTYTATISKENAPDGTLRVYTKEIDGHTLDHSWDKGKVKKAATCIEDGIMTYTCTACGEIKEETIKATGHTEEIIKGKDATCTEAGLSDGKKCSVCGEIIDAQKEILAKGHTEEVIKGKEATCTETGLSNGKKCSVCGEIIEAQTVIPVKDHTWDEGKVTKVATCTETGEQTFTCTVCETTKKAEIPANGHKWLFKEFTWVKDGEEYTAAAEYVCDHDNTHVETVTPDISKKVIDPTCTESGLITYTATISEKAAPDHKDREYVKEIDKPALGHTIIIHEAKAATCEEDGITEGQECSVCGEVLKKQIIVPKLGHEEVILEAVEPTCTEPGLTEGKKCSRCNKTLVNQEDIPAIGHDWDDGKITKGATCTEDGEKLFTCKNDASHTKTEAIPSKGHAWSFKKFTWIDGGEEVTAAFDYVCENDATHTQAVTPEITQESVDATCTVPGKVIYTATISKESAPDGTLRVYSKEIDGHTLDHAWDKGKVKKAATCTEDGIMTYTCTVCGETKEETIKATGHTEEIIKGKDATCTEPGLTDGKKCSVCGVTLEAQKEIPAKGHTEEVVKGKDATCTEPGLSDGKKCSVCGEIIEVQKEIPAKGHTEEVIKGKDATCTEPGLSDGKKCSVCGEIIEVQKEIPATGHTVEVVKGKDATCTEPGLSDGKKCSVCGETLEVQKEIPAKGHTEEVIKGIDATETATGLTDGKKCSVCGEILEEQKVIPKITPPKENSDDKVPTKIPDEISPSNPVSTASVDKQILNAKTDGDPKGSVFGLLQAKGVAKGKTSIKVSWKKVAGAKEYIVYGNKCGTNYRFKKLLTVKGTSFTQKKLKKGTYYKYLIVAVNGNKALATSKGIHVATTGGKVGNSKSVTTNAKKSKVTLNVSKTFKLKVKANPQNKKLKVKKHRAIAYESGNKKIATISNKGVIKAVKKGTCYVYAYAQNGVCKKIKVTVK